MEMTSIQDSKFQKIKKLLLGLAEYYRHQITSKELLNAYAEDLEDLELETIGSAIRRARKESKFFPLPAVIREYALGSTRDEAQDVAGRIVEAMHKFGWPNPEKAKEFIGPLGWQIVEREGGWENLCRSIQDYSELGIRKAQWRELAASIGRRNGIDLNQEKLRISDFTNLIAQISIDPSKVLKEIPQDK